MASFSHRLSPLSASRGSARFLPGLTLAAAALLGCACLGLFAVAQCRGSEWLHVGPLFDQFPLTLEPGQRTEAAGPLFYSEQSETRKTWGLPPLFSRSWDPALDLNEYDFGYPVITYRRFGPEYRWQFIQIFSVAGSRDMADQDSKRFTIFPLYFRQRSADPSKNYTAFAPFYGHLQDRLFRDEIFFVMFPAYSRTRKGDVVTYNYLYPFFDVRYGDALHGWQFWPFYGQEHKDPTLRTNGFGDVTIVGGHDSRFILWPLFLQNNSGIGTSNPQRQQALLPFYSYLRSPQRDSTTLLWPLFSRVNDRAKQYREWETPWPLIVFARGEGKTTSRVFPFFSQAHTTNLESDWYLWPLYKYNRVHVEALDRERTRILFFLFSDTFQTNAEAGIAHRLVSLWPLFTHQRDDDGNTRLQIFAPLEPILPYSRSIARDYSPVWSVWRSEKNPRTGANSQSLLWNLYRRDASPGSRKCSLLFGLFQYQSNSTGKELRLFYVPVMKSKAPATTDLK